MIRDQMLNTFEGLITFILSQINDNKGNFS